MIIVEVVKIKDTGSVIDHHLDIFLIVGRLTEVHQNVGAVKTS